MQDLDKFINSTVPILFYQIILKNGSLMGDLIEWKRDILFNYG